MSGTRVSGDACHPSSRGTGRRRLRYAIGNSNGRAVACAREEFVYRNFVLASQAAGTRLKNLVT